MNNKILKKQLCNSAGDINSTKNSDRFCFSEAAMRYPSSFRTNHFHDWMEKMAIMRALDYIPKESKLLDFPCGTGRLTTMLLEDGFNLTSADRSKEMLEVAQQNYKIDLPELAVEYPLVEFLQEDLVSGTKFTDMQFDAVVCHRLFHHLVEPATRILAIKELKRIAKNYIVFSFFDSHSYSAYAKKIKNYFKHNIPTDRVPIDRKTLTTELENQNIKVIKIVSRLWGISPLCIVIGKIERYGRL